MGLKILHTADWHLDSPFAGFSQEQRTYLKQQQKKIPRKVADLCRREDCDLVLLAGDIFDGTPSRETVEEFKAAMHHCGVPVVIAPGNHDFCAPGSPWLEDSFPENVFVFTGGLESVTIQGLDCRIYGAGFQSMDCAALLEGFRAEGEERYKLAVLHGDPMQKNSPYNPITAAQVKASGLHYLALGHIHKAGSFHGGDTLCAWSGCPMGRGWDETGEKGVCIAEVNTSVSVKAISLELPRFWSQEVDIREDAAAALEAVLPAAGNGDFYRITLTGYGEANLESLKAGFAQFPHLELVDQTQPPLDLWAEAGTDTLEGVYFRMLKEKMEADPDNASYCRQAAEISRKLLLGKEVKL